MQAKVIHRMVGHAGPIYCLAKGLNPNTVLSGSSDRFVAEWNLQTGLPSSFSIKLQSIPYSLLNLEDNQLLLIGNALGEIHWIDTANKQEIKCMKAFSSAVFKLVSDGTCFYACSGEGELAIGTMADLEMHKLIKVCNEKIRYLAIDFDNQTLILSCGDGFTRIVALQTGTFITEFSSHGLSSNCALVLPDGKLLTGGRDAYLNTWVKTDPNFTLFKTIPAHNFAVYDLALSPDGKTIASASRDKTIKLWNTDLAIQLRLDKAKFQGHGYSVNALYWDKQTQLLLSAGDDRTILSWEIASQEN
jgi:WD repeat-containing protein 61